MITLTRLNGTEFILNDDLIETVEEKPDTTIRLTNGNLYIVTESAREVVEQSRQYKRGLFSGILRRDEL